VKVHAREVAAPVDSAEHNRGEGNHPDKAGNVTDASHDVRVTVADVNDMAPSLGGAVRLEVSEGTILTGYAPQLTNVDDVVTSKIWSLATGDGATADTDLFTIDKITGALSFKQAPDSEKPSDANSDNHYEITVMITTRDDAGYERTARQTVTVVVTNLLDELLAVNQIPRFEVAENEAEFSDTKQLSVSTHEVGTHEVEYRLLNDEMHDYVTVSKAGVISLRGALNHEVTPTIEFWVQARYEKPDQGDGDGWYSAEKITLTVTDVNEDPTSFILKPLLASLKENTNTSKRIKVADLVVEDPDDESAFPQHQFRLTGTGSDRFEIYNGALYLRGGVVLDHETRAEHRVTVGLEGTQLTQDYKLDVSDVSIVMSGAELQFFTTDENRTKVFTDLTYLIDENDYAEVTLSLATAFNIDQRDLFRLEHRLPTDEVQRGSINLHFNEPPDFEAIDQELRGRSTPESTGDIFHYAVRVVITVLWADGRTKSATKTILIALQDVPEAPVLEIAQQAAFRLTERASSTDLTTGFSVRATDQDAGDTVTLSVKDDDRFYIENGELRVRQGQSFDYEEEPEVSVTIKATDTSKGRLTTQETIKIHIKNINDTPLKWDDLADISLEEGLRDTGLYVRTARAVDLAGQAVTYAIVGDMQEIFEISDSGTLMFKRTKPALDFDDDETPNSYDVEIRATSLPVDTGGQTQSETQTVRVTVTNLLDEELIVNPITNLSVVKGNIELSGTTQLSVETDERGTHEVEYRLSNNETHEHVEVSPQGVIRLRNALDDRAVTPPIKFSVQARYLNKDQIEGNSWYTAREITINVTDVTDQMLTLERDTSVEANLAIGLTEIGDGAVTLKENSSLATPLYKVRVPTPDVDGHHIYFYLTGNDAGRFTIDGGGNLRFIGEANFESPDDVGRDRIYDVTIHAREVTAPVDSAGHNLGDGSHPAPAGADLDDASHAVRVKVIDAPDAPVLEINEPETPFIIYAGTTPETKRIDTGYRLSPTDEDDDEVTLSAKDNQRFVVKNGDVIIKKGQTFDLNETVELKVKATATENNGEKSSTEKIIRFTVVDPTGLLDIDSQNKKRVDELVAANDHASLPGEAEIIYRATAQLKIEGQTVNWKLGGADAAAFGINDNGEIWFRRSPDYERGKKIYNFDLIATTASGQIQDREAITIEIRDVDEAPSGIHFNGSEDAVSYMPLDPVLRLKWIINADTGLKVTTITLIDDDLGTNQLAIDGTDKFEIRLVRDENENEVKNKFELRLKAGQPLEIGNHDIVIRHTVTDDGPTLAPVTFTVRVDYAPEITRDSTVDWDVSARAPSMLSLDGQTALQVPGGGDSRASGKLRFSDQSIADDADSLLLSVKSISNETVAQSVDRNPLITDVLNGGDGKDIIGKFGTFYMRSDGNWTYILDANDPDTLALEHGETAFDIFRIRLIDAAGLTGKHKVKINVVGGHEAPTRAEGTAPEQTLEFSEDPQHSQANGLFTREMFGINQNSINQNSIDQNSIEQNSIEQSSEIKDVKIMSMALSTTSQTVREAFHFYHPALQTTSTGLEISTMDRIKFPFVISASDLVARSGNEMYGLGFDDSVNTTDVVAAGTTVTLKYRLVDGHGVESSEYEISFRFSVAPSNEPAVEPSGASFGQEHVDDNIPDNKPGTNEDERAPDPADAERKSVTGNGNGIEHDVDDGMPPGLNDNFQTVSMDF
jgi:VCBS repeat-containing protein